MDGWMDGNRDTKTISCACGLLKIRYIGTDTQLRIKRKTLMMDSERKWQLRKETGKRQRGELREGRIGSAMNHYTSCFHAPRRTVRAGGNEKAKLRNRSCTTEKHKQPAT